MQQLINSFCQMLMRKSFLLFLSGTLILSSCWDWSRKPVKPITYIKVWGYKPVFTIDTALLRVQSEPPRPMKNAGKIYVKGNLIFQNDVGYGIHVIDNSIPSQARPIGFIKVNGSSEISIKDNNMYVNSYNTLVVLDVSDWQNVSVVKRIPDAFQQGLFAAGSMYYYIPPPEHGVYYDCTLLDYQPGKLQSGWVRDSVYNYCYYN